MEWMIYPVSGVMKLWFLALHHGLGLSTGVAWVVSLFGLIVTVRSVVLPFSYIQYRAGRIMVNLRPVMRKLDEDARYVDTGVALREYEQAKKQAQKDAGHRPAAGCVPALIQIPVFIGLYQVLLRMARPDEGIDAAVHPPIGFLTSQDVQSFLAVRVGGMPLPAHVRMTAQQYAELGVSHDEVLRFVAPYFVAAAVFSTLNMLYSLYRSWLTMDFASRNSRILYRTFIAMAIVTPLFPLSFGLTGPAPVAIAFYWFANSFWTMAQMVVLNVVLDRRMPISAEFKQVRDREHEEFKEDVRAKRRYKRTLRLNRVKMLVMPHRVKDLREHSAQAVAVWQERLDEKRQERQRFQEARKKARKELTELQKAEREAKSAKGAHRADDAAKADPEGGSAELDPAQGFDGADGGTDEQRSAADS
ncbi:membrane protein insertase YidC [Corynebacterium aquilae]|uniref:membrane protein insertase YidC n=1 Tax=Corynebacterium aquilae TaxID=203263 RepID=UPI0009530B37|nr:membrane protein insertase YidC [Corynebacterium aquilae]